MSHPGTADPNPTDPLKSRLESWLNQHNQTLLEEVMATWQQSLAAFQPDDALLAQLREATAAGLTPPPSAQPPDRDLAVALDLLEGATSQSDLLRRLLDALAPLVERSALFILKQGMASLYAQRGFDPPPTPKPGAILPAAELEALIQGAERSLRRRGPGYTGLLSVLGGIEAADLAILPLRHRRKTVALVLVDSGLRQQLDAPAQARALVLVASSMLAALATGREEEAHPQAPAESHPSAPTQVVPEPIEPAPEVSLDARTRAAAERLARVLVGDVELYFPAKVAQARTQGNLYGQLRDELERSRATFVERFGEEVERKYRIFTTTVIQQLCEGDASRLGNPGWS